MNVRLLVLDVDGVLTDGSFLLTGTGEEWKAFYAPDGIGLKLLKASGVKVVLLSGRHSGAVSRRARELALDGVVQGRDDKAAALHEIGTSQGVPPDQIAYMGDDLPDLAPMRAAGFSAAPADARAEVRAAASWVAPSPGGRGAVRDLCEHLLRSMGRWDEVTEPYR